MNVDIAALRAIERDKDIPFETVIEAIETALLTAYKHTEGHQPHARVDIDRKSGVVRVLAHESGDDATPGREWDDTPGLTRTRGFSAESFFSVAARRAPIVTSGLLPTWLSRFFSMAMSVISL